MFYDNFIKACISAGKSPSAVVVEAGISKPAVTRWKKGQQPTDAPLQKLSEYFGISKAALMGSQEKSPASDEAERPECWDLLTREEREKAREYIEMLIAARGKR